ncbi:hypothetical protein FL966_05270 [Caproiciproducens galactitolivorans]|uniref:Uncharacterized protein n=1 Tax=Caproiciproducens galactitolivorans TaxID=642589 RepID=A0A4Z0YET9_9FIRM|nr:hypothetical protein [Caproiciproducens galactitolivorans]QEY34505.1 hypothetical protein FL966_05270 [Caproiciproducens galactitolivorans]TGJ77711.1 hypothetical protein CAGA_01040 [Caproiciproducens galactitolivorans]
MQKIHINANSLLERVREIQKDGMGLIELCIIAEQTDGKYTNPAFLHFTGISTKGEYKDYESIDELPLAQHLNVSMPA